MGGIILIAQAWDSPQDKFKQDLDEVLNSIGELLRQKNAQYGNAALEPKRIFSKASPKEQLLVRIDDKLSRIANQQFTESDNSDTIVDLIGYLVMYKIQELREKKSSSLGTTISPIMGRVGPVGPLGPVVGSAAARQFATQFEPNF